MRRVEHLALGARHGLKIEQLEAAVQASPGVHHEYAAAGMVAVSIKRPVGHHDVGILAIDEFAHLLVALQVDLGIAIHLTHEDVACPGHFAGVFALLPSTWLMKMWRAPVTLQAFSLSTTRMAAASLWLLPAMPASPRVR